MILVDWPCAAVVPRGDSAAGGHIALLCHRPCAPSWQETTNNGQPSNVAVLPCVTVLGSFLKAEPQLGGATSSESCYQKQI